MCVVYACVCTCEHACLCVYMYMCDICVGIHACLPVCVQVCKYVCSLFNTSDVWFFVFLNSRNFSVLKTALIYSDTVLNKVC